MHAGREGLCKATLGGKEYRVALTGFAFNTRSIQMQLFYALVLLVVTSTLAAAAVPSPSEDERPIQRWNVVLAHDAATGEMDQNRDGIIKNVEDAYTITQSTGLVGQLTCGARAFDYRPYCGKDGVIVAHLGSALVKKPMTESIQEIQSWLSGRDELVMLYVSHVEGEANCQDAVKKLLTGAGVAYIDDCSLLSGLTVSDIYAKGKLVAVFEPCVDEQYDPKVTCYSIDAQCYTDSKHKDKPWETFTAYMKTATVTTEKSANLRMVQAHWQSSTESVPLGLMHKSSVLLDEQRSKMNSWVVANIASYATEGGSIGLVELDNVCDGGEEVMRALQAMGRGAR
jgi:hypothetical protein